MIKGECIPVVPGECISLLEKQKGVVRLQSKATQMKENSEQSAPLCIKCKSFFGNQATASMCSQCYKTHHATQIDLKTPKETTITTPIKINKGQKEQVESEDSKVMRKGVKEGQAQPVKKEALNKDACSKCNRKLRLLGVECRCGLFFCNSHRLPEDHTCTFNHKLLGKERLTKQVLKVQNGKIDAI